MIGRVLMNHNVCDELNFLQRKKMNIWKPVGAHHGDMGTTLSVAVRETYAQDISACE